MSNGSGPAGRQLTAIEFRHLIEEKGKLDACRIIRPECETEEQSDVVIRAYVSSLFRYRKLASAGIVLWGERLFNPRPISVQMVWRALENETKVLIQGASSVGKSYTGICWTLLDWWSDPEYTTVKLISTTGGHAKGNTFGTMSHLHKQAIVPMPGIVRAESISLFESDKRACISIVRIKEGADNSGVLQGFHPLPRPHTHPIYGDSSRVRAVLDEAEEIALGVWKGCENMLGSRSGHNVKVFGFYNPKDITSRTAQLAEPLGGWGEFDVETGVKGSDVWISRKDWTIVRLDAAKTENVKARKKIYEGIQTYEGYQDYAKEQNGNSLSYYTFGRGAYPPDGTVCVVVSQRVLELMRGEFIWAGSTIKLAGVDIAVDGRDRAVMSVGRMGNATGFIRYERTSEGWSKKTARFREERKCIQLDQIFQLPKGSSKIVGDAIKSNAIRLGIAPENTMLDRTGNGGPVHDYLLIPEVWSDQVKGIDFSKPATEIKILEQDQQTPLDSYEGIHSEVWFALAKLGEFGYFAISPTARADDLERELLGRRYKLAAGKKLVVEKKDDYIKRLGCSPDNADSATILVHCGRTGGSIFASMTGQSAANRPKEDIEINDEAMHRTDWVYEDSTSF